MSKLKLRVLSTWLEKSRGLIGATKASPVFFRTRWGIHTFGLKFPIDVLILDSQSKVVKMVPGLLPNRILFWSPRYDRILELPAGEISKRKIIPGSKIFPDI